MRIDNNFKIFVAKIVLSLFCIASLTACNLPIPQSDEIGSDSGASAAAGVTIVSPSEGAQLQVGEFVDVHSQIADPLGGTAGILMVNDEPLRNDQFYSWVLDGDLYQPWIPDAPGTYVLQVILETNGGNLLLSNQVTVYVGEEVTEDITITPTITFTPELAFTSTPTLTPETPTETPTLTPTPTPDLPMATGKLSANCRFGPGSVYDVEGYLMEGETVPIVGRNPSNSWWVVELPDRKHPCWVWDGGVIVTGNTAGVPIVAAPPTPTPTYTPTPEYSACHDYLDVNTCNNDPHGFGGCSWNTGLNQCEP